MRPAHLHFLTYKPGFKTLVSQLYDPEDKNIETDVQFGVTRHLIGNYVRHDSGKPPAPDVKPPWYTLEHTFVMEAGTARLPKPPITGKAQRRAAGNTAPRSGLTSRAGTTTKPTLGGEIVMSSKSSRKSLLLGWPRGASAALPGSGRSPQEPLKIGMQHADDRRGLQRGRHASSTPRSRSICSSMATRSPAARSS